MQSKQLTCAKSVSTSGCPGADCSQNWTTYVFSDIL